MTDARRFRVAGTVQGVGFRPFVARLAAAHGVFGWVRNGDDGVEIHAEGEQPALEAFARALRTQAPPASRIEAVHAAAVVPAGATGFQIRESQRLRRPATRIPPDLPLCLECLQELRDSRARRFAYPYINCTNCGPRFSIVVGLPYDRERTTMARWELCAACREEYGTPADRRFHAEPIACPRCGPTYHLVIAGGSPGARGAAGIREAAALLGRGCIIAVKGIGGYHLCCDARDAEAVRRLRERKYRKSKPFAVMVRDLDTGRTIADLDAGAEALLQSAARPIVLAPARETLPGIAPEGHHDIGIMLPYAPIHELLFAAGAPAVLVMTSGNASSEPIAFEDGDAMARLDGIADAFLVGDRPIARRVEDSVARADANGPVILRRSRGYAPAGVARLPGARPLLALGADLKNTVTLVVGGEALVSQHIGDLEHLAAREAFQSTVRDLLDMYEVDRAALRVACDLHPGYASTALAAEIAADAPAAIQHHRAHVASVLAERGALDTTVVGVAFDGTGFGDDGTIWGGELFLGSIAGGFARAASLRPFALPGGDAAARWPVSAAAGVLMDVEGLPELTEPPFSFPERYAHARRLAAAGLRTFTCTSAGRLFDAAAALLGWIQPIEYEGQAAIWLEQRARGAGPCDPLPLAVAGGQLDFRPALLALAERRLAGEEVRELAWRFHETVALGIATQAAELCERHATDVVVLSGGTFQNVLLVERVRIHLPHRRVWINHAVPPNDGGISLGQAALAAVAPS